MSGLADAGVSLAVIIQRSHEPPASFAQRVRERADALASVKRLPATVFFVASRRVDEGIERGRAAMARTLVHSLARAPRPRPSLLLACDRTTSHEAIDEMKRVATEAALAAGRTVRVARPHFKPLRALPDAASSSIATPPEVPRPAA